MTNVYPVADAGGDRVVPAGPGVGLDGSASSDPDSSPGTDDDLVGFEWFDVTGGTPVALASGASASVPLAAGLHRIRLRVTDRGGLSDVDEAVVSVGAGPGGGALPGRWLGSFHVGSAHPVGKLDPVSDANVYVRADLGYTLTDRFRLELAAGLAQLTAESAAAIEHPRFLHASLDGRVLFPFPSGPSFFLEAGPGVYRPKNGSSEAGFNLGLGFQLAIKAPYRLELGADDHRVPALDAELVTVQLGVLFR